jgi:hypothetical protein
VIDGVRVIRHPGEQRHTDATLTFGVGARDETLRTVGVTHMIEHLVMGLARRTPIEINADVDLETTNFEASGSPKRVAEFLATICSGLARPPVERMPVEAGVLAAEDGWSTHPLAAFLLNCRYGADGPGLAWLDGAGYDGLTADHVTAFARRWYTTTNAILQVTGPLPDDLRLALPQGPRAAHERTVGRLLDGPIGMTADIPGAAILLRLPPGDAARVPGALTDVLEHRIEEECRHIGGHSYIVDRAAVVAPGGQRDEVIFAEARDGTEKEVARAVAAALTSLAANGPTRDELELSIARTEERLAGPGGEMGPTTAAAMRELLGVPPVEAVDLDRVQALTIEQVRVCLTEALSTAVVYAHEDAAGELTAAGLQIGSACPVLPELPAGRLFRAPLTARAFVKEARTAAIVLTDHGLAARDPDGVHEIRWDDIAGVMRSGGVHVVFGRTGCVIPVGKEMFRGAGVVVEELRRRVDPALVYDESSYRRSDDES